MNRGEFVGHFQKARRVREGSYVALCPVHGDRKPSLSIDFRGGKALLNCRSQGCSARDIIAAVGLTWSDAFDEPLAPRESPQVWKGAPGPVVATYDYRDEHGELVLQVTRHEPKTFRRRYPDPLGGWLYQDPGVPRVPYRLQEVLSAARNGGEVWVAEGEKDVETLRSWGLVATTNEGGALKWTPEHSKWLVGCSRAWILPDGDEAGRKHGTAVEASLRAAGVETVLLPPLPWAKDVSAWEGGSRAELERWALTKVPRVLRAKALVKTYDDALARIERIQSGTEPEILSTGLPQLDEAIGGLQRTLTIVGSQPGHGKSGLMMAVVRHLTERGRTVGVFSLEDSAEWMAMRLLSHYSRVPLFLLGKKRLRPEQEAALEEHRETVRPMLERIITSDQSRLTAPEILADATKMLDAGACAIFVDHLGEVGLQRTDRHDRDIGEALGELMRIPKERDVPLWVLAHTKRPAGEKARPSATDFAFSADLERKARVALSLSKEDDWVKVTVVKQTNGPAGRVVELAFDHRSGLVR